MPSHNISFSICVDLSLDDDQVKVEVADNEGRMAPKFLLLAIQDELNWNHQEALYDYMHREAEACRPG